MLDLVVQHHRRASTVARRGMGRGWDVGGAEDRKGEGFYRSSLYPSSNLLLVNSSVAKQKSNLTQRII